MKDKLTEMLRIEGLLKTAKYEKVKLNEKLCDIEDSIQILEEKHDEISSKMLNKEKYIRSLSASLAHLKRKK